MKKLIIPSIISLVLIFVTVISMGTRVPFPRWITDFTGDVTFDSTGVSSFTAGSITSTDVTSFAADAEHLSRQIRYTYDVAVDTGEIGTFDLGQDLPANAVITRSWYSIVTQFVAGAGTPTLAFQCEDAGNLKAAVNWAVAVDLTAISGSTTTGVSDGTPANYTSGIAANCNISAVVATNSYSSGKAVGFIEYSVSE